MKAFLFIVLIALLLLIVFVMRSAKKRSDAAIQQTNAPVVVHWLHINLGTNSATQSVAIGLKSDGSVMWALPQ